MDVPNHMQTIVILKSARSPNLFSSVYWKLTISTFKDFHLFAVFFFFFELPTALLWILNYGSFSLKDECLWIDLLVHFNTHERPVLAQWALTGLLTLLSCFKNPQSPWSMWLWKMNGACGLYICTCRSFFDFICRVFVLFCAERRLEYKLAEWHCDVKGGLKVLKRRKRRRDEMRWGVVSFGSADSGECRSYSAQINNCHSSLVPRTYFSPFSKLSHLK